MIMKLSIITINYNNAVGLRKTAASISDLSYHDFEWLVIDGGSTDDSLKIIGEYRHKINYYCSEQDGGVYNAMNKGIAKAKGDYLIFMNSGDCFYSSDTLNEVFRKETSADIIYGNALYVYKDHEELKTVPYKLDLRYIYEYTIYHQASFIKRNLLLESKGYDEKFKIVSDWKMWLVWILQNRKFEYVDTTICRFDAYGISTDNDIRVNQERDKVFKEVLPPGLSFLFDEIYAYEALIHFRPNLFKKISGNKVMKKTVNGILKLWSIVTGIKQ